MYRRRCRYFCVNWLIGSLILLSLYQTAWATSFPYGDFIGSNVKYYSVTETPTKVPQPSGFPYPLFGIPTIFGDTLEFLPSDFNATSTGGSFPFTDSQLSMNILTTNPSHPMTSLLIQENGSYSLVGGGASTQAIASINVVLAKILEVNGAPIPSGPISVPATIVYTNLGSAASSVVANELIMNNSILQPPPINQNWTATAYFDFDAALAANQIFGHATTIKLSLDNCLTATSEVVPINNPSTAHIDKKDFSIQVNVDPAPEPGALVLVFLGGLGLITFGSRSRRRRPGFIRVDAKCRGRPDRV